MKSVCIAIVLFFAIILATINYKSKPKMELIEIPIDFLTEKGSSCIGSSCIKVEIEGNELLLELDTGFACELALRGQVLEKVLNKNLLGESVTLDIKGNKYTNSVFQIDRIDLGSEVSLHKVFVKEEDLEFITSGAIINLGEESEDELKAGREFLTRTSGRIGIRSLSLFRHCIIDFQESSLVWIRNKDENFTFVGTPVAWEEFGGGIPAIFVETDYGLKRFILDTGADYTVINPINLEKNHDVLITKKFIVNGCDLGPSELHVFEFASKFSGFGFDGIIGRDFFLKHAVYLDFEKKTAWIGPKHAIDSEKDSI